MDKFSDAGALRWRVWCDQNRYGQREITRIIFWELTVKLTRLLLKKPLDLNL